MLFQLFLASGTLFREASIRKESLRKPVFCAVVLGKDVLLEG